MFLTDSKAIVAFKHLLGKSNTDVAKELGNEAEGISFNVHAADIWLENIDSTPATAVTEGVAYSITADLVLDPTSNSHAYFAEHQSTLPQFGITAGDRVINAIPPKHGVGYEAKPFDTGVNPIPVGDPRDWIYQYNSGIFYQQDNVGTDPGTIQLYIYIGNTLFGGGSDSREWQDSVLSVETDPSTLTPSKDDRYLIGDSAVGIWAGKDGQIADYRGTNYKYITPTDGFSVKVDDDDASGEKFIPYHYEGTYPAGSWKRIPTLSENLYDANTIIKSDTDNTPVALIVPENRLIGRKIGGSIDVLTPAEVSIMLGIGSHPVITSDRIPRGNGTTVQDGTWTNSGNNIYPETTGSNIGDATHRIGTIYMNSILDIPDNISNAFQIREGTNVYLEFDTNNGAEVVRSQKDFHVSIPAGAIVRTKSTGSIGEIGTTTAHDLQIIAGNNTAITISNTTRDIGIGTSSISAKLHTQVSTSAGANYIAKFEGDSGSISALVIKDDGNVGIGYTNPNQQFDVYGNIQSRGDDATVGSQLKNSNYLILRGSQWNGSATDFESLFQCIPTIAGVSPEGRLAISVNGNEYLSIKESGNVGIGLISPAVKLHVNSTIQEIARFTKDGVKGVQILRDSTFGGVFQLWNGAGSQVPVFLSGDGSVPNYIDNGTTLGLGNTGNTTTRLNITAWNNHGIDIKDGATLGIRLRSWAGTFGGEINLYRGDGSTLGVFLSGEGTTIANYIDNNVNLGLGLKTGITAKLHIKATGSAGATYGLKVDDSSNNPLLYVRDDGNIGIGTSTFGTNATGVFGIANGNLPTTQPTDIYQQYSADITAGNAAPHFMTETGDVIKLYKETALTAADNTIIDATYDATEQAVINNLRIRINELETKLQAHGLLT